MKPVANELPDTIALTSPDERLRSATSAPVSVYPTNVQRSMLGARTSWSATTVTLLLLQARPSPASIPVTSVAGNSPCELSVTYTVSSGSDAVSTGRGATSSGVEISHPSGGMIDTSVVVVVTEVVAETVSLSLLLHPVVTATHATNDRVEMTLPFLPMPTITILKAVLCQVS